MSITAVSFEPYRHRVLVASTATKSGTQITGNTFRILVVKMNPGYAPNSGSPGTGTIVAEFCH